MGSLCMLSCSCPSLSKGEEAPSLVDWVEGNPHAVCDHGGGAQSILRNPDPCHLSATALEKSKQLLVRTKHAAGMLQACLCYADAHWSASIWESTVFLHTMILFI